MNMVKTVKAVKHEEVKTLHAKEEKEKLLNLQRMSPPHFKERTLCHSFKIKNGEKV